MTHSASYLEETARIAGLIDPEKVEEMARELVALRECGGRLFIIGLGGSAANASHAVNDFRKLCGIEAYAPTDNVAELTARANDEGWDRIFIDWLCVSRLNSEKDWVLILSVGGGTEEVSLPITRLAMRCFTGGVRVMAIVGRSGGAAWGAAFSGVLIPTVEPSRITPHTEGWQSVILHCLVSHPSLQRSPTKW